MTAIGRTNHADIEGAPQVSGQHFASFGCRLRAGLNRLIPGAVLTWSMSLFADNEEVQAVAVGTTECAADFITLMAYESQLASLGQRVDKFTPNATAQAAVPLCVSKPWKCSPMFAQAQASPAALVEGVRQWHALGVNASRLVLATGWFAKDFACNASVAHTHPELCAIDFSSGWTSYEGGEPGYGYAMQLLAQGIAGPHGLVRQWDSDFQTPFFDIRGDKEAKIWDQPNTPIDPTRPDLGCNRCNYIVDGENKTRTHRVYYDDPSSLSIKYSYAVSAGLRGVGMWTADSTLLAMGSQLAEEMWAVVPFSRHLEPGLKVNIGTRAADDCWAIVGEALKLRFCSNGSVVSVLDTKHGIEHLPVAEAAALPTLMTACTGVVNDPYSADASEMTVCAPEVSPDSLAVVSHGSGSLEIKATFGASLGTNTKVVMETAVNGDFILFRVTSVAGAADVHALRFLNIPTSLSWCAGSLSAGYELDGFAVAVVGLNPSTFTNGNATRSPTGRCDLSAQSFSAESAALEKGEAVVWAGLQANLTHAIAAVERTYRLPEPTEGGEWLKSLPAAKKDGYLFLDASSTTMEEALGYTERAGLRYLLLDDSPYLQDGGWSGNTSGGHYNVSKLRWGPDPTRELTVAIASAHRRGLRVGLHTMSACISTADPYVTPFPDRRLAAGPGDLQLISHISPTDTTFLVVGAATSPSIAAVMVEHEIMSCEVVALMVGFPLQWKGGSKAQTQNFTCSRGSFGTSPRAHTEGAEVRLLSQAYGALLPSDELLVEIAANLARTINAVDADMAYFDGLEGALGAGYPPLNQAAMATFHFKFWDELRRSDILVESSASSFVPAASTLWHLDSRSGQTDYCATDVRSYMQYVKEPFLAAANENLSPLDLGWAGYVIYDESIYATVPDEMGFLGAKAAGWSGAPSIQTTLPRLRGNGRTEEALARLAAWNGVELPANVRAMIRAATSGSDFELHRNSSGYWVTPTKHHQTHVTDPHDPTSFDWTVHRAFAGARSAFGVRARALPATAAINDSHHLSLLPLIVADLQRASGCAFAGGRKLNASAFGGALHVFHTAKDNMQAVHCVSHSLAHSYDLSDRRPLSVTLDGDGSGALFVVQLVDVNGGCRNFAVNLSFVGTQVVSLPKADAGRIFAVPQLLATIAMPSVKAFSWDAVTSVNLLVTGTMSSTFTIKALTALAESPAITRDLSLELDGVLLRLPNGLRGAPCGDTHCSDYVECVDVSVPTSCRSFDANNGLLHGAVNLTGSDAAGDMANVSTRQHMQQVQADRASRSPIATAHVRFLQTSFIGTSTQPRLELSLIERSSTSLGPFPARP